MRRGADDGARALPTKRPPPSAQLQPPPPEPRGQLNLPEFRTNQHSELQGAESRGDLAHWSSHGYLAKEPEQNDSGKIMESIWSLRT